MVAIIAIRVTYGKDTIKDDMCEELCQVLSKIEKDYGRKKYLLLDNLHVNYGHVDKELLQKNENEIETFFLSS